MGFTLERHLGRPAGEVTACGVPAGGPTGACRQRLPRGAGAGPARGKARRRRLGGSRHSRGSRRQGPPALGEPPDPSSSASPSQQPGAHSPARGRARTPRHRQPPADTPRATEPASAPAPRGPPCRSGGLEQRTGPTGSGAAAARLGPRPGGDLPRAGVQPPQPESTHQLRRSAGLSPSSGGIYSGHGSRNSPGSAAAPRAAQPVRRTAGPTAVGSWPGPRLPRAALLPHQPPAAQRRPAAAVQHAAGRGVHENALDCCVKKRFNSLAIEKITPKYSKGRGEGDGSTTAIFKHFLRL